MSSNYLINDPVPRNVSKFPIHQTYLTDDAEKTGNGGYKFKAPEVWSSARSGKKSIAIRSIQPIKKRMELAFRLKIRHINRSTQTDESFSFDYSAIIDTERNMLDVISDILDKFDDWATRMTGTLNDETNEYEDPQFKLYIEYTKNAMRLYIKPTQNTGYDHYFLHIVQYGSDEVNPSESFNIYFNQPKSYMANTDEVLVYQNVWDHASTLYFHASFVPFDNYQYLGELRDEWNDPIIFQDPNTSPLFNVWITSDLKTPLPILHESFIFRFTFIISSDSQYKA